MSFFIKKQKIETIAIFDIGSSTVGCALVSVNRDEKIHPTIVAFERTDIAHRKDVNHENLSSDMFEALLTNAQILYNKKMGAPDKIICVLASPWYETVNKVLKDSRELPFIFNEKNISDIIEKEIVANNAMYQEKFGQSSDTPEIFEKQILNVSLNGYQVTNPIGKKTNRVDLDMIISVSPASFLNSIKSTLEKVYHATPVSFSSFVLDSFLAIRDRYTELQSYMIVDIGGDVTDIAHVRKNTLESVSSFPFGRKTLINTISTKLDISLRDANELFILYSKGSIAENLKVKMNNLMKEIEDQYAKLFRSSIESVASEHSVSNPLFLTIDPVFGSFFINILQKQPDITSLFYNDVCTVVSLENKDFADICKVKDCKCDPFLMIEAIAYKKKNKN